MAPSSSDRRIPGTTAAWYSAVMAKGSPVVFLLPLFGLAALAALASSGSGDADEKTKPPKDEDLPPALPPHERGPAPSAVSASTATPTAPPASAPVYGPELPPSAANGAAARIVEAYPRAKPIIDLLVDTAAAVGAHPIWLANLIDFESARTWNPAKLNPNTNAVGLIQFLPSTAAELLDIPPDGHTERGHPWWTKARLADATAAMGALTARQQMAFVRAYLRRWARNGRRPLDTKHKLYMAVYHPAAISRDPHAPLTDDPKELARIRAVNTTKDGTAIDTPAKYAAMLETGRLTA